MRTKSLTVLIKELLNEVTATAINNMFKVRSTHDVMRQSVSDSRSMLLMPETASFTCRLFLLEFLFVSEGGDFL